MAVSVEPVESTSLKKIDYSIYKFSSFSTTYIPSNIQEDKSNDQTSRWSSDSNNPPQFLTLKLDKVAIVKAITFGKYEKTHVCNLKKFKVYGGLNEEHMIELLDSGLKNDCAAETFELCHTVGGKSFPCRYIKILPLQSWGPSFNFSIWFVELTGVVESTTVKNALDWFNYYRDKEATRICLKYLRRTKYVEAFEALQRNASVQLEEPFLTQLYDILVKHGDYTAAEQFMEHSINSGLLAEYIGQQEYSAVWRRMQAPSLHPGMRGGHQMCIDPYTETIYLLGGWDGNQDLSDLWSYHVPNNHWSLITRHTEAEGGPSARSCHKMCMDPERRQIFTLGRYLDTQFRTPENLKSDFYIYDIESNRWILVTEDTSAMGGPQLIFDHQMCMDVASRTIYVFGGRVLTPQNGVYEESQRNFGDPIFSGLYSYHVSTNTWKILCADVPSITDTQPCLRSRVGHSMLFHPIYRKLFIFAGQRSKEYLNDFFSYDVDTGNVQHICEASKRDGATLPAAGFTQRATIDPELDEIYVLSGLSKDKEKRDDNVQNSFWVYYIQQNQWCCVYRNENTGEKYWSKMHHLEPCPRFAHQLVYNPVNKVHYLFGGNPGRSSLPKLRLDDFWRLQLSRPTSPQLMQLCKVLIRKHRFQELALTDSFSALDYLQTSLSEIIDHEDPKQTTEFQQLASLLFQEQEQCEVIQRDERYHSKRVKLFETLSAFFPESMTEPKADLIDLVPI